MHNPVDPVGSDLIECVLIDLANESFAVLKDALAEIHPAELAHILESLPPDERRQVWTLINSELHAEILSHLHDEVRLTIIDEMSQENLAAAAQEMEAEDLIEVLDTLPVDVGDSIIQTLEQDHRQRLEVIKSFEEGTAGRLMSNDVTSVRDDITVAVVLRYLRLHPDLPTHTDALMVVNDENQYLGKLAITDVLTAQPETRVSVIMQPDIDKVSGNCKEHDLLTLFDRRDLISVAVVDEQDYLLGRITIDEVVDLIREEAEHTLLKSAGLDEEDLFSPMIPSAKRRGIWLGINLITVFLAAWVIGQFEEVLDKMVALAVLMPVVASMGGIAGSQTLTLTIRGLALDQIAKSNVRWLTIKEIGVGMLNGIVWSVVVALVSYLWFHDLGIALVIAIAMVLNLLAAAISGVSIPLILKRMGIDPALSGAVILTTATDIIGFLSFLGLASLFLL